MQRKGLPQKLSTSYPPGTRYAIDVADYTELDLGHHSKAIHAVEVGLSLFNLVDHVRYIHRQYWRAGHTLKVVFIDAQFATVAVIKYLDDSRCLVDIVLDGNTIWRMGMTLS